MKRIFVPTRHPEDWRLGLAEPEKQWKPGYSAQTLAECWEAKEGFPVEVGDLFARSGVPFFQTVQLLLAIPEYAVELPGGERPSQNDIFVLGKCADGELVSITVEGKVRESFGPTLGEWRQAPSPGKQQRLAYLTETIGLPANLPDTLRYQFLHRTASAVIEARRFNASRAAMIVHSFGGSSTGFADYQAFTTLYGVPAEKDRLLFLKDCQNIGLYCGWVSGVSLAPRA